MNFRNSTGFSFDFLKNEGSLYLASSEDGTIHKCSKSYTDGYLESYFGHKGNFKEFLKEFRQLKKVLEILILPLLLYQFSFW